MTDGRSSAVSPSNRRRRTVIRSTVGATATWPERTRPHECTCLPTSVFPRICQRHGAAPAPATSAHRPGSDRVAVWDEQEQPGLTAAMLGRSSARHVRIRASCDATVSASRAVASQGSSNAPSPLLFVRWGSGAPRASGRLSAAAGCATHTILSPAATAAAVAATIATMAKRRREPGGSDCCSELIHSIAGVTAGAC